MKKVVIAIDSFKGCLPSAEAGKAAAEGIRFVYQECDVICLPIADGGEGMLDVLIMATNGQEGVDMAIKELPDLIICEIMMPVKDGFECCREVKEGLETCGIPFIMLTAKVEDEDVVHGLEIGADDYVLKPFTPSI